MKINWGTGIAIAIAMFISFIMYFVVNMATNKKYDHDLVTSDYYKEELAYQKEIDQMQQTNRLGMQVRFEKTQEGLEIIFPEILDPKNIKGSVFLYRPSDKQLDVEIPITTSTTHLLIPKTRLKDGRWNINVAYTYNGQPFLTKHEMMFNP